jgi:hypothetical protein
MTDSMMSETTLVAALNQLSMMCHTTAENKGFHQAFEDAVYLEELASHISGSSIQREWASEAVASRLRQIADRHRLLELSNKLMLTVSELGEGLESLRKTGWRGHIDGEGNFGEEMADAIIRLVDLMGLADVSSPGTEVLEKMGVNTNRPHMHGKQM